MRASQKYNDHLFHKQGPQLDLQRCPSPKWFQPVLNQVSIGLNWSQLVSIGSVLASFSRFTCRPNLKGQRVLLAFWIIGNGHAVSDEANTRRDFQTTITMFFSQLNFT